MNHIKKSAKNVSGVILSGGSSSRLQRKDEPWQDKALIRFDNEETLLENNIQVLLRICNEIIIVVNDRDRKNQYLNQLTNLIKRTSSRIEIVIDNHDYLCSGPSLGLISAIPNITNDIGIVIPVDMPFLTSSILDELLSQAKENSIVVPYWRATGKIEPLVFAINFSKVVDYIKPLRFIRNSRADDIYRLVPNICFLALQDKEKKNANYIFTSLNNQTNYHILKSTTKNNPKKLFTEKCSIQIEKEIQLDIVNDSFELLNELSAIIPNEEIKSRTSEIVNKLICSKMYFHAGIIISQLLDLIPDDELKTRNDKNNQLITAYLTTYLSEAKGWEENKISFLAFHAYSDAYRIAKYIPESAKLDIQQRMNELKKKMKLNKKNHLNESYEGIFKQKFPGFLTKAKSIIHDAEVAFNKESPVFETNFLWDHSYRVSKIAYKIAMSEGINPIVPTFAALLHDSGKFVLGKYHGDNIPEEKHSASIANKLLTEAGLSKEQISNVIIAISALYSDKLDCDINCQIVHDADRLEKLGTFGIANFFTKMALRGRNLSQSIIRSFSRELTYANAAPRTLFTKAGRNLAVERSKATINFFKDLLEDLRVYGLGRYFLREHTIRDDVKVMLVIPETCTECSGHYIIDIATEEGLKCEKLKAEYTCSKCNVTHALEFCLPLLEK